MRLVRRLLDKRGKIELAAGDRFCDRLERANFGCGETGAGELGGTRKQQCFRRERIDGLDKPRPDRFRTRGGELL